MGKISLIMHGGTGTYDPNEPYEAKHQAEQREGLQEAVRVGWEFLNKGGRALDAVERVVNMLEECPAFNAGIGAALGKDKQIDLDASIMDGRDRSCGAVAGLDGYVQAISVARRVMTETKHVFLAGRGANEFAKAQGFQWLPPDKFQTDYQLYCWNQAFGAASRPNQRYETVGAVARDSHGDVAAGTSTGGMTGKQLGRVGDTPLIGPGTYADNKLGGASCTGQGEEIIKVTLAKSALDLIRYEKKSAQAACEAMVEIIGKSARAGRAGIILIDPEGNVAAYSNERFLPRAYMSTGMSAPRVEFEVGHGCC